MVWLVSTEILHVIYVIIFSSNFFLYIYINLETIQQLQI